MTTGTSNETHYAATQHSTTANPAIITRIEPKTTIPQGVSPRVIQHTTVSAAVLAGLPAFTGRVFITHTLRDRRGFARSTYRNAKSNYTRKPNAHNIFHHNHD